MQRQNDKDMIETTTRWLTYKEELALAVFFSNVEKFKCLVRMPNFKVELITEPMRLYNEDTASLATILSCFKILYAVPGHEKLQMKNNQIVNIIREKCGLEITEHVDLRQYNPEGRGDILGERNYQNFLSWVLSCREGGHGQGKESWPRLKWRYRYVLTDALREQHLLTLEQGMTSAQKDQVLQKVKEKNKRQRDAWDRAHTEPLSEEAKRFVDSIDIPGAILALFDEGKMFLGYTGVYDSLISYVLNNTMHITLRVGGYSYRVEGSVIGRAHLSGVEPGRVECLYCDSADPEEDYGVTNTRYHIMRKYDFEYDDEFVKYAEEYDYKCFALGGETHPMVYYYVNNIDTGWYSADGLFQGFYSNNRGLQALADVAMIRGFKDIKPATAAVFSDSGNHTGDQIFCGPAAHYDKRDRASSQRKLFEDARIPYLNIGAKEDNTGRDM